jgi:tight adherence protein B
VAAAGRAARRRRPVGGTVTAALAGVLLALAVLALPARAAVGAPAVRPRVRPRRVRPAAPTDVAAVAGELATLTRGGLPLPVAWGAVAQEAGDDEVGRLLVRVAAAASAGEPVAGLLRSVGAADLAVLASTVRVHERTGAPVADLLDRAASGLRSDADARLARRTALAAPLATARVLVALPPAGLLLGVLVGADPVAVLTGTAAGRAAAAVGLVAALSGWGWSRRLVRAASSGAGR